MMTTRRLLIRPVTDLSWPVCTLCPEALVLGQQQHLLQRNLQRLICSLQDQEESTSSPMDTAVQQDAGHYELTLDTTGFSPEDLSVRLHGRKLRVSGKTEKKEEEQDGWRWHSVREFRQELELPEGVNPEDVSCCLTPEGRLQIQAAKVPCEEEAGRELSIRRSPGQNPEESQSSQPENQTENKS
ncbi:heat shock protein 30-like [Synchiropus splendidus]|uniref:heat shock protein 30-like n=1 Tax=Synchiropus splendidus TaxID=270530 RepID=UPI00237E0BDF|nr:heat shock protein 30-like [Synchiropus splendidus]